jgi:hypothetical protein
MKQKIFFAAKRRIIELLDVGATLAVEDEEKVIYVDQP